MPFKAATATEPRIAWVPSTDVERNQVREELDKLVRDDLFRRSNRYSALLQYIVEKALQGEASALKERSIGIDVFQRVHDYDTNADPVVRFCAAEVRKRLAQFYRTSPDANIEIELPVGAYVPQFYQVPPAAEVSPGEPAHLAESETPRVEEVAPIAASSPSAGRWIALAACVLAACFAVWLAAERHAGQKSVQAVWGPLLNKSAQVQICTGVPPDGPGPLPETQDLSIKARFLEPGHKISFATASAIARISGFLQSHQQPYSLIEADAATTDTLRDHPLVLVNANNNRWTLFMVKQLRFRFETEGDTGYIIDTQDPSQRNWKVDFTRPYLSQTEDYALVARFFDPTIRSTVLIVAGIGSNGTEAAADFAVSEDALKDLARHAPNGWENANFEALLRVEVVQGHLGATRVVKTHFW